MKTKKISKRLSLEIVLLMLSFSAVLLFANSLLLRPLYYYSVERDMIEGLEQLAQLDYFEISTGWSDKISSIDPGHSYDITIEGASGIIYSSSVDIGIRRPGEDFQMPQELPKANDLTAQESIKGDRPFFPYEKIKAWEDKGDGIAMGFLEDDRSGSQLFVGTLTLESGVQIYLTQGVEPILKSVQQANILLVGVTLMFLLVAVLMAVQISKKFTQPIRVMQKQVNQLSHLEFDQRLQVHTGDELENLGRDINQLADRLEEALLTLQEQNKQLERDIVAQRKFISNASHELRTPLALIKGYADEIVQGFVKNQEQERTYVGYIASESSKMKRLLNEILALSRLESGRMSMEMLTLSVKGQVEAFINKYTGFIEEHGLVIKMDLVEAKGVFDPIRFEQVLANYISNAGKYADEKRQVIIQAKVVDQGIRISVSNSGGPIDQEVMDYIWDGFYKADESRSNQEGSYGLGLSIVKAIQEVTGQAYGCYNEAGYVTFWFDVALASSQS